MFRAPEGQAITLLRPQTGALHSIRVTLRFLDVAFDDCRPKRMAGYGELTDGAASTVAGLVPGRTPVDEIAEALETHARVMRAWVTKTFAGLQEHFDREAGAYRSQLDRTGPNVP
jgi:hypothetical protein